MARSKFSFSLLSIIFTALSIIFTASIIIRITSCYGHSGNTDHKHVALFIFGDSFYDAGNNNYINTSTYFQANYWPYGETFFNHPTGRCSNGRLIPDFIGQTDHKHVALFIFGDSLYDAGNNNYINTSTYFQANYWPNGETFFNHPTRRFSDGRLIPDFIAEYAKLPLIPSYLPPDNYHQFTDGVNFASAGAGALVETHAGYVIDLHMQLSNFKNVEKMLRNKLGDGEAKKMLSRAVYLFSIGSNDYTSALTTNNSSLLQSYSQTQYVRMVIGNFTAVIKEIYKQGGRKFGLLNLPQWGCIPSMKAINPASEKGGCYKEATVLAKLHNRALHKVLQKLDSQLKGFKYSYTDFYTILNDRMNNPSKYGFKEGGIACCGTGPYRGVNSCGGKRGVKEYQLCSNPYNYVFFDSSHPTEMANQQFAELMWSGTSNVTTPYNLKELFEH